MIVHMEFIIHCHPVVRRYIASVTNTGVKETISKEKIEELIWLPPVEL
jgi:hypothetical protein